jgi:hypothetical protein
MVSGLPEKLVCSSAGFSLCTSLINPITFLRFGKQRRRSGDAAE